MFIPGIIFSLLGKPDGKWTWNVGVSDADIDADAFLISATNDGVVDPP